MTADLFYGTHFLYPSALFASREPHKITTILGSCVSVCLYDKLQKIGGINHYMLPYWNGEGLASPKYGNIAIEKLLELMTGMHCSKSNLCAKIFGGGDVLAVRTNFNIGVRNIEIAERILHEYGIPIVSRSTGGALGRKIIFNTYSGEVVHAFIHPVAMNIQTANIQNTNK